MATTPARAGVMGKCKAQLKPKYLILESVVLTRPQQAASPIRMHTKEKWQLSTDAKTLSIKSDVDFADFPSDISASVAGTTSGTTKYKRTGPYNALTLGNEPLTALRTFQVFVESE